MREAYFAASQRHLGAFDAFDHAFAFRAYAAADEAGFPAFEPTVPNARPGSEVRAQALSALRSAAFLLHRGVIQLYRLEDVGRADLLAARPSPSLIQQMRVEDPGLRQLLFLVPDDRPVRAGIDDVPAAPRLHRIDDDDAVVALADRVAGLAHARRVVAVVAHHRQIGGLHHWARCPARGAGCGSGCRRRRAAGAA